MKKNSDIKVKKMSRLQKREGLIGYLFMIPTIIGFTFFVAYPLIASIYYSLTQWDGLLPAKFVGLDNFKFILFHDPTFFTSIKVTLLYVLLTVPITLVLGIGLALLLNKTIPGIKVIRTLFYLPVVLPSVAALVLWLFIYKSDYGLLNNILRMVHLPAVSWLESEKTALISISVVKFWAVGGTMIIFLSGLQSVPTEIFEAAEIDGASNLKKFFTITLPMITPILFLQLITGVIGAFQSFNEVAILTKGGPDFKTRLISYDIWQTAFNDSKFGRATAEVWILFVIIMIFTILIFRYSEQYVYYENDNF
jgi:ABC-type sugar transport system permease subunit